MFFELGATQSIIDGALGRKSLGARNVADGIVLCTGASYNMSMDKVIEDTVNFTVYVPRTDPLFATSLAVVPLQLLAYYISCARGLDVDKPRNLAKSVTVE